MQALQRRRERWEYHNQQRLELVLEIGQQEAKKQIRRIFQALSFLLYLAYRGGFWLMKTSRVLWVQPKDLEKRLQDAEQQRLRLISHPHKWLK
jgi:hypothetical protein